MYTIRAINEQGATIVAGIDFDHPNGGKKYASIDAADTAARSELDSGWKVLILDADTDEPVKEFIIR